MPLSGDVRVVQDGLAPSARSLTNATPLDVAMVDGVGNQITGFDPSRPATSATTSVAQNVVSVSLLAANANRRQWMVYNAGTKNLLVAFAATATLSVYVMQIPPNGFYESPENGYTGVISGIWAGAGGGSAKVTEITT